MILIMFIQGALVTDVGFQNGPVSSIIVNLKPRVIARSGVNNPKWSFFCGISPCSDNRHDYKNPFRLIENPYIVKS